MAVTETLHGFIETTQDALLVFEGCRRGLLPRTSRRLQEKERRMIQSGSIFVFDERESGIKRWTDGRMWSPSRILGNFLIYREVSKRFPSIGDRRRSSSSSASSSPQSGDMRQRSYSADHTNKAGLTVTDRGQERQLVGSLSDVHAFRKDGLIKKTVSIVVSGVAQHLISYYHPRDVLRGELRNPTSMPHLAALEISPDLVRQNFRVALSIDGSYNSSDMVTSASTLLSYPLFPPGTGDCQQQHQPQQQQRLHNQLRSLSAGSSYGYGETSTISSSFYSNALVDAATDQKFSHMGLYTVPHPQHGVAGLGGSPFTSASTPLLPSSVRHPFDGSGNGGGHGIMTSSPYSPSDPMRQHLRGVRTRNDDSGIPGGVQPTYHGATVMHPLHNGHHLGPSFTATGDPTTFENFHSSQSEYSNGSSSVTDNTTLPGPSLFGFTTEVHGVATGAAGTQHHHHQQYEQTTTSPSSYMLSSSLYYPSSTC